MALEDNFLRLDPYNFDTKEEHNRFWADYEERDNMMKITQREKDVLKLLYLPNREIADRLCISEGTVKTHIIALAYKLHSTAGRTHILVRAIKNGIVALDELIDEEY